MNQALTLSPAHKASACGFCRALGLTLTEIVTLPLLYQLLAHWQLRSRPRQTDQLWLSWQAAGRLLWKVSLAPGAYTHRNKWRLQMWKWEMVRAALGTEEASRWDQMVACGSPVLTFQGT